MKIVIITDGNSEQGLGHVYQSKTLASYLKDENNVEITFLTKSMDEIADIIKKDGFPVIQFQSDEEIFIYVKKIGVQIVVFDKIDVAPQLAQRIKMELGIKLVIFTNLTSANNWADISVMGGMGSHFKNVILENESKIEFLGPKYLILRQDFFYGNRQEKKDVNTILLLFGGSDPARLTFSVLEKLLSFKNNFSIKVVLGAGNKEKTRILSLLNKKTGIDVEIFVNVSMMADLMRKVDLAFVSPGISFFEALCVGTPVICFYQNAMQFNAWKDDLKIYGKNDISQLPSLIESRTFIEPSMKFVKEMEIGQGIQEIINRILD